MFTLLSLINNLSNPCSSQFYLNNAVKTPLWSVFSPLKEHTYTARTLCEWKTEEPKEDYSEMFFDLDWLNNKVMQPQTTKQHQCWKFVNCKGYLSGSFKQQHGHQGLMKLWKRVLKTTQKVKVACLKNCTTFLDYSPCRMRLQGWFYTVSLLFTVNACVPPSLGDALSFPKCWLKL